MQRNFADRERIRLLPKSCEWSKVVGTRDAFVVRDFNTAYSEDGTRHDDLEREWMRLESDAIPAVRKLIAGDLDEALAVEVRVVLAMHLARSFRLRKMFDDITSTDDQVVEVTERMLGSRRARRAYRNQFGSEATRAEVEALVREGVLRLFGGNRLFVQELSRIYNVILTDWMAKWHVQVIRSRARRYGFMTSDAPVVVADATRSRLHVALGDAAFIYMPVGRYTAVAMTTKPQPHVEVAPMVVQELNHLMRRNSFAYLACHPDDDWRRALMLGKSA